jgi:hypothetical protein
MNFDEIISLRKAFKSVEQAGKYTPDLHEKIKRLKASGSCLLVMRSFWESNQKSPGKWNQSIYSKRQR